MPFFEWFCAVPAPLGCFVGSYSFNIRLAAMFTG
jgi:hypothetical protein